MKEVLAVEAPIHGRWLLLLTSILESIPSLQETALASSSAVLLVLSFPNFDLWWLAWIGLTPLLFAVAKASRKRTAFLVGMIWGAIFFYGTCWWLTYPMIHHSQTTAGARIPAWLAYTLLVAPVLFVAVFPALACLFISRLVARFGSLAVLAAPLVWITFDWLRRAITGFDWNALGYSQAFHPAKIQSARIGGIHAVTFLIVTVSAAVAFILLRPNRRWLIASALLLTLVVIFIGVSRPATDFASSMVDPTKETLVIAVQPNVPMTQLDDAEYRTLLGRHVLLTNQAFSFERQLQPQYRLVIWPESPMNFAYSRDPQLQRVVANFAQRHHTSMLLNSLEPASNGGAHNSAILINPAGQKIAQYDKIRLMPFGEYVPLPRWLPGSGSVRSIVGEFTPGISYTLMPLGALRAGVFICVEAAHPNVARAFTNAGADVLINISNDGYLGPTPVMRQHLANAIFRAVENDRDLIRVTNTGITTYINSDGSISGTTPVLQESVRTWTVSKTATSMTFYSRHGDVFAYGCALVTLGFISATFMTRRKVSEARP